MNHMNAEAPNPRPPSAEGVFSLEDLDKIIESEDPNFKSEMENIKSTTVENTEALENLKAEGGDAELAKDDESEKTRKQKIMEFLLRPWNRFTAYLRLKRVAFKNRAILFVDQTKNFFRHQLPEYIKYLRSRLMASIAWFKERIKEFKALSRAQKLGALMMCLTSVAALMLISKTLTGAWLPSYIDGLPRSLSKGAEMTGSFKTKDDLQDLFLAFPEVEYHVLLHKVIVNLKSDANSGPNPMGIFEFYLGLDSKDTAVEVKDREREILDQVQRAVETFTYSEVNSYMGKVRVKAAIRDRLNDILNQGRVFHVYFNTIVTNY